MIEIEPIDRERFSWLFNGIDFDKVSDWEMLFIGSCERQFKAELSIKQSEILERIYQEKGK
jgi:hypothetical protein